MNQVRFISEFKNYIKQKHSGKKSDVAAYFGCDPSNINHLIAGGRSFPDNMLIAMGYNEIQTLTTSKKITKDNCNNYIVKKSKEKKFYYRKVR